MKKLYYTLLLAVLPVIAFTAASCSDDKDLPDVSFSIDVAQGVVDNGTIYVAQGDTINIAAITVQNLESNKGAAITNVNYYWDGFYYAPSVFAPFDMIFPTTENTALGAHNIGVTCTVLAPDKSIAVASLNYPVMVVANESDLPANNQGSVAKTAQLKH